MSNLAERLDSFPEAWKPKTAGDKLIGELVDVDQRDSEYGEPYAILVVLSETDGREYAWHAFHTMARNEVVKKKPQLGERVGIVYAGLGEAAAGMNAPVRWRLLVDRPTRHVDYAPTAVDDTAEPGEAAKPDPDIPF